MTSTQFQLKLNTFKKAMVLIALLYIVFMHPLFFCMLMLVICVFLGKSAADPKYCLLLVDLFTSKVYIYGMKNRSLIPLKLEKFYKEVASKRKNKKMRLQTDLEFKQKKIFLLNKKYNLDMFSTAVKGCKAFAAEQKLRELKKRLSRLLVFQINSKTKPKSPNILIQKAVENMNSLPTVKYGV